MLYDHVADTGFTTLMFTPTTTPPVPLCDTTNTNPLDPITGIDTTVPTVANEDTSVSEGEY